MRLWLTFSKNPLGINLQFLPIGLKYSKLELHTDLEAHINLLVLKVCKIICIYITQNIHKIDKHAYILLSEEDVKLGLLQSIRMQDR